MGKKIANASNVRKEGNCYYIETSYSEENQSEIKKNANLSFNVEINGSTFGNIKDLILIYEEIEDNKSMNLNRKKTIKATNIPNRFNDGSDWDWVASEKSNTLQLTEASYVRHIIYKNDGREQIEKFSYYPSEDNLIRIIIDFISF